MKLSCGRSTVHDASFKKMIIINTTGIDIYVKYC